MLIPEILTKFRRAHFVQKQAIKPICRKPKASRKTVRRLAYGCAVPD